ncbi:MAG TPA: DUF2092 domain-containing protein [Verrucomicrobiae bacterium]|jgi:hypothetical protein|nr:DUF2092 domain-containing protein [Verrucomicrobiae bacterium]
MKDRKRLPLPVPVFSRLVFPLAASFLLGLAAPSVPAAGDKAAIEPRADELLKRMGDYLGQAQFFSVNAEIWQDIELSSGQRVQADRTVTLQVRRPDRLHTEVHSTRRNHELFYDGDAITLFNRAQNFYGTVHTSGPLDDAMDVASERFGIAIPLEDFIRSDPHKDFLARAVSGVDLGPVTVMGVPCEHLAFTQDNIDWQVWIQDGAAPVPKKFVITYKDEPDSPQFTAIFSNWDFTTKLPDFVFKFEPPAGAAKIKVQEIKAENQSHKTEEK